MFNQPIPILQLPQQPQPQPSPPHFCFLLIRQPTSLMLSFIYFPILVLIFVLTLRQVYKLGKSPILTIVSGIYFFLLMWAFFCGIEVGIGWYVYFGYQETDEQENVSTGLFMVTFSSMFLLNSVLSLAPYNWHKNLFDMMNKKIRHSGKGQSAIQRQEFDLQKCLDYKIKQVLRYGLPIRQLIVFSWTLYFLILIPLHEPAAKIRAANLTLYMVLVDSVLLLTLFIAGKCAIYKNTLLKDELEQGQLRNIKILYIFLLFAAILRVGVYSVRMFVQDLRIRFQDCQTSVEYNLAYFLGLFVEALLIDYMSAVVILSMYYIRQDKEEEEIEESQRSKSSKRSQRNMMQQTLITNMVTSAGMGRHADRTLIRGNKGRKKKNDEPEIMFT